LDVVEVAGAVDVPVAVEDGETPVWPFRVKRPGRYGRRS
jgi:hypothetical protein